MPPLAVNPKSKATTPVILQVDVDMTFATLASSTQWEWELAL